MSQSGKQLLQDNSSVLSRKPVLIYCLPGVARLNNTGGNQLFL